MTDRPLEDIGSNASYVQDEVLRVMAEIRTLDKTVFNDIVRVAMTPGATFVKESRTVDFLGGHTVLGQTMYDKGTEKLRSGFQEAVASCVVRGKQGWDLAERLEKQPREKHDLDEPVLS